MLMLNVIWYGAEKILSKFHYLFFNKTNFENYIDSSHTAVKAIKIWINLFESLTDRDSLLHQRLQVHPTRGPNVLHQGMV